MLLCAKMRVFALLTIGPLIAGCSTTLPAAIDLPGGFPNHSEEEILANILTSVPDTIKTLQADATLNLASSLYSGTAQAHLAVQRGDSLLATLSGTPLRINIGQLLLTADSVFFYNRLENKLYLGGRATLVDMLPSVLLEEPVFDRLLGILPPLHHGSSMMADSANYYLNQGTEQLRVNPRYWRTDSYVRHLPSGETVEAVTFESFRAVQGVFLPGLVTWERALQGIRMVIRFRDITLNPVSFSLQFDVPSTAERIEVGNLQRPN